MNLEEVEDNGQKVRNINLGLIVSIMFIVFIILGIYIISVMNDEDDKLNTTTYAKIEVEKILKDYVKYPDTLEIQTIEYYKSINEENNTELWKCEGYFIAENKIGLKVKNEYIVYITYSNTTNSWKKGTVFIDGKLMT